MSARLLRLFGALLALAAGLGPWWAAREISRDAFPGFLVAEKKVMGVRENPRMERALINPGAAPPKAHSATLAQLPDGTLVAAWYAGSGEGKSDVGIWLSRRRPDQAWSEPRAVLVRSSVAAATRRHVVSLGNPVLLTDPTGRLGLLFVSIAAGRWSGSSLNLCWSDDGGLNWGKIEKLTTNPLANLGTLPRNPPLALRGGGWAVPIYEEFIGRFSEVLWLPAPGDARSAAVSRIHGGMKSFQPSLVALSAERVLAFTRDDGPAGRAKTALSEDRGRSWSRLQSSTLPNVDSGLCLVRLPDGRLLAAYNNASDGKRENLSLAVSDDQGSTWLPIGPLEEEVGQEFSYPYMIVDQSGRVRMVYSSRRSGIAYAEFNLGWINQQVDAAEAAL